MIDEKKIDIKYGMQSLRSERELAKGSFAYIVQDVLDIKSNYIRLGFHLDEFERCKYYEDFGYSDFYEFCEVNLKLDKTAVSRAISVFYNFADREDNIRKMWIAEKYRDYNYSQLCEMLPLKEDQRKKITSSMTVRQIRDYKKSLKKIEDSVNNEIQNATSQQDVKVFSDSFDSGLISATLADYLVDVMQDFSSSKEFKIQSDSKNVYIEIDGEKYRVALFHSKENKEK